MTDITINAYLARGTQTQRLALTPTPFAGMGVYFYETDTKRLWCWDAASWQPVNGPRVQANEAGAARTLVNSDSQGYIPFTNAGAITVTVSDQSTGLWGDDSTIALEAAGTGEITVAAAGGVTINYQASCQPKSSERYAVLQLVRRSTNVWTLFGSLKLA